MINLIPIEEKVRINKEFYFRFLSVIFVILGFLLLIACVSIFPTYILLVGKKSDVNSKLDSQKKEPVPEIDQKALNVIDDLNNKINIVTKAKGERYDVSAKIIKEILSKKTTGIQLTRISYEFNELSNKNIKISGTALNREQLLSFRQLLENDKAFSKVDLPISNFVKDSDIEFNLTLNPS